MQRRNATNPVGRVPPTLETMHGEWEHSVFGSLQLLRMAVIFFTKHCGKRWLGSRVFSVPDSGAEGPGFKLQSRDALSDNSLRQTVHTRRASVHQAAKLVAALLRVAGVTAGLAESKGSLSHYLQADCQEPGSAPEPYTLGNRVWATFLLWEAYGTSRDLLVKLRGEGKKSSEGNG